MQVQVGYKYRIKPNPTQAEFLSKCFGCTRLVYNKYVSFAREDCKRVKQIGGKFAKLPEITQFKQEHPFLDEIDSLALANAKQQFSQALKNWWKSIQGKRKGRKVKAPSFKKKGKCRDTYTTNNQNGTVRLSGNLLKVPKIKEPIEVVLHRELPNDCTIKSATFSREKDGTYFVSLNVMFNMKEGQRPFTSFDNLKVVGLDMSFKHFIVSSNETENDPSFNGFPKYIQQYRKDERKLKRLSRRMSRKQRFGIGEYVFSEKYGKDIEKKENSKNREKARIRLAKANRRVANRRKDYSIQTAAYYAKNYDVIVIEDIDMQVMAQSLRLGKSANDLGFGMFKSCLEWQTRKRGSFLIKADKWFASSKTCNECGSKNELLKLSDREWVCPSCGCLIDRDLNAARNIRDWFYNNIIPQELRESTSMETTPLRHLTVGQALSQLLKRKEVENSVSDDGSPSV